MAEAVVRLPSLVGGQAESWAALIELAPAFGQNWILVGGQMVFLHEVERQAADVRPTDDLDVVVDLRAEPAGLARIHAVLIGKASAVARISSQSAASRAKHARDFDSLARLLGPHDRASADLSKGERKLLSQLAETPDMTELGPAQGWRSRSSVFGGRRWRWGRIQIQMSGQWSAIPATRREGPGWP